MGGVKRDSKEGRRRLSFLLLPPSSRPLYPFLLLPPPLSFAEMDLGSQGEAVASGPRDRGRRGKDRTRVHLSSKEKDRCCGSFLSLLSLSPSLLHSTQASSPALLPPSSRFSPQPNSHDVRTPVSHAPSERAERRESEIRSAENGRRDNNSLSHTPLLILLFFIRLSRLKAKEQ